MTLDKTVAKKVGTTLDINWEQISLDDFYDAMKVELEHKDIFKHKILTMDDYFILGKIVKAHLKEGLNYYKELKKMENRLSKEKLTEELINETVKDKNFKNKLKFELCKEDKHYQECYNKALGKYSVDSPDQLDEEEREEFYDYLDGQLKGHISPIIEDDLSTETK